MRKPWVAFQWLGTALLAFAGCMLPSTNKIKAPTHEEQYSLPPDDKRYSSFPEYPKEVLNKDDPRKAKDDSKDGLPQNMRSSGGMGGMGAPGIGN